MWIRSQDKRSLRKYKGFFIDSLDSTNVCGDDDNDMDGHFLLGKYESIERALGVLDDIESFRENHQQYTYNMPLK